MKGVLQLWRRNRMLAFGIVATTGLLVAAGFVFDFRVDDIAGFLWACMLMIAVIIACAGALFLLLLALRTLFSRPGS